MKTEGRDLTECLFYLRGPKMLLMGESHFRTNLKLEKAKGAGRKKSPTLNHPIAYEGDGYKVWKIQ